MNTNNIQAYATVDELITILQRLSGKGLGSHVVVCNEEYFVARKNDEVVRVNSIENTVSLGGYD